MKALVARTRTAPWWVVILEEAREWGTVPWQLAGGSPLVWHLRFEAYREAHGQAGEIQAKQAQQAAFLQGLT